MDELLWVRFIDACAPVTPFELHLMVVPVGKTMHMIVGSGAHIPNGTKIDRVRVSHCFRWCGKLMLDVGQVRSGATIEARHMID